MAKALFVEGNDVHYGQDFGYYRGVPAGVYDVTQTATGWKLTAPGYGAKDDYGNGALRITKEAYRDFPGLMFSDVRFFVTFVPDTTAPSFPVAPWGTVPPCKNGHVFYWTSGAASDQPDPGLRCECGAVSYGDMMRRA